MLFPCLGRSCLRLGGLFAVNFLVFFLLFLVAYFLGLGLHSLAGADKLVHGTVGVGRAVLDGHDLEALQQIHELLHGCLVGLGRDAGRQSGRVLAIEGEVAHEHVAHVAPLGIGEFGELVRERAAGTMDGEDELVGLTATLAVEVEAVVVEPAVAEAVLGKLLELRTGGVEHAAAEVGKLLVVLLQPKHLAKLQRVDDGLALVEP